MYWNFVINFEERLCLELVNKIYESIKVYQTEKEEKNSSKTRSHCIHF